MTGFRNSGTDDLLRRAAHGDQDAAQQLLVRYSQRLKKMVAVRMDRRLSQRVDPSDVVQETLIEASRKLPNYLRDQPLPFYPWIRQLALEQIIQHHRRHLGVGRRKLTREELFSLPLPRHSEVELEKRLVDDTASPSDQAARKELRAQVQAAMEQLDAVDREILALRYLEQLTTEETAAVLGLTVAGAKSRQRRALQRLRRALGGDSPENE